MDTVDGTQAGKKMNNEIDSNKKIKKDNEWKKQKNKEKNLLQRIVSFRYSKQRKRKRPLFLLFISIIFLFMPFGNLYMILQKNSIQFNQLELLIKLVSWPEIFLLAIMVPVAIGLWFVTRWGWVLFLFFSGGLIFYNLYIFYINSSIYNLSAVSTSFLLIIIIIYITSKDISYPFFQPDYRGWRLARRKIAVLRVRFANGLMKKTLNLSVNGFYVKMKTKGNQGIPEQWVIGSHLTVELLLSSGQQEAALPISTTAILTRIDNSGIGFAMPYLSRFEKRQITKEIEYQEQKEEPVIWDIFENVKNI